MRRRTWVMLVLFLGVLCWAVVSVKPAGPVQTCALPDGTTLTLRKVTWKEPHRYDPRPWWGWLVPGSAKSVTAPPDVDSSIPVAWFEREGRAAGSYGFTLSVADEHGCETQLTEAFGSFEFSDSDPPGKYRGAFPLVLSQLPPRGRRISIRIRHLWPNVGYKPVGEFRLPVLAYRNHTEPRPVKLRASAQDGPVTFTLKRFVTGADLFDPDQPPWGGTLDDAATHVWVEVRENGEPSRDWEVISFEASDGSGSRFGESGYCNPKRTGGTTHLTYSANLFQEVPAWRLRLEAARTRAARFSDAELWTVPRVPVPKRQDPVLQFGPGLHETTRLGQVVRLHGITWDSAGPPTAEAVVSLPGFKPPGMMVRLVKAVDDRGRAVELPGWSERYSYLRFNADAMTRFRLPLRITRKMKSMDLTFAIQKTRFVEVVGAPQRPQPSRKVGKNP